MDKSFKNRQYYKFCFYGFLKNLRFFDAFFLLYLIEKGLPYTQIGMLYAVREIFINVFEIPSGIVADTYGRKNALAASLLAYIVSFAVFYMSDSFWLFVGAFVLYGVGDAFRSGTHKGMMMDYLEMNHWQSQNIMYYGHTRSWSQRGAAISSLVAGMIVFYSGSYEHIFLYTIIPYLLNFLLILSYPKELNRSFKIKEEKKKYSIRRTATSFLKSIKQVHVLRLIHDSAIHSAYLRAVKDYIQLVMVHVALLVPVMLKMEIEKKNGLIIGVLYFFIYLLSSGAARYSSKAVAKRRNNISLITLLMGFSMGLISGILFMSERWILVLLAFAAIYLIENVRKPILTGYIADNVPTDILASVLSAQSMLRTLLTAAFALLVGIVADRYGIGVALISVSVLLLISTLLLNVTARKRDKTVNIT